MGFREIDDRYPEYAKAYEPVKGGKHHKKLPFPAPLMLAIAGLILLLTVKVPLPSPGGIGSPTQIASDTSPSEPSTAPAQPPESIPPAPDGASPERPPEMPAEPGSSPASAPESPDNDNPSPASQSTSQDSDPDPAPGKASSPESGSEGTQESQDYTEPAVSISHIYYWECLGHIEVEYEVTPGDAENLSSSSIISSYADPSMTLSMPSFAGGGTIQANADGTDHIHYMSTDVWETVVTLSYTLDGEAKTMTATHTGQPEFQGFLWLSSLADSASGSESAMAVSGRMLFRYPSDDRHKYNVSFSRMDVGWMKEVPLDGGGFTYEEVGGTRTVWDGTGTGPFLGPSGPSAYGEDLALSFDYDSVINVVPDAAAADAGATHFYLIAEMAGTGTDTDGTIYKIHYPTSGQTFPQPLSGGSSTYEDPTVSIDEVNYWGDLNIPAGLRHLEVVYDIDPGDADPGSITSSAVVSWVEDPSRSVSLGSRSGDGTFYANIQCGGSFFPSSASEWSTEVTVNYTLNGEAKSLTETVTGRPDLHGFWMEADDPAHSGPVENMTVSSSIRFSCESDDRHTYQVHFTRAELEWADEYGDQVGGTLVLWDGSGTSPFSGPTSYEDGGYRVQEYFFEQSIDASPPSPEAVQYCLIFYAEGSGTDTDDGTVYPLTHTMSWYTFYEYLP